MAAIQKNASIAKANADRDVAIAQAQARKEANDAKVLSCLLYTSKPLRVILNGLGKDAAQIISRINGFTFVETKYDYKAAKLNIVYEKPYSTGLRATVKCYGADDVQEGVAIMHHENVGVSITGNSTNPTRFQHPVRCV